MEEKPGFNINTPTAVIVAGLIVAGAIIFVKNPSGAPTSLINNQPSNKPASAEITIAPITESDHFYGNPKAKVVMIEFSDLECPYCKIFHPTLQKVVDESRGEVAWVYRHFPIEKHTKAKKEAQASECAAEIGGNDKFWEYISVLFSITPSNNGLDLAELPKIASQIGLDADKFNSCISSGRYEDKINSQYQDGLSAGVSGTPSTVIMNQKGEKILVVGSRDKSDIKEAINSLLD